MTPRAPTTAVIRCGGCNNHWTGLSVCHCGACHRTFTGITAFDLHRVGSPSGQRLCVCPTTVLDGNGKAKLVPVARVHWLGWGLPTDEPWYGPQQISTPKETQ